MCNSNNFVHYTENHESVTGLFPRAKVRFQIFKMTILFLIIISLFQSLQ